MGYIAHDAIIVTGWNKEDVTKARDVASECGLGHLLSGVNESLINGYYSFCIFPDGSKEGWDMSNHYEERRAQWMEWMDREGRANFVCIRFGGDTESPYITKANC